MHTKRQKRAFIRALIRAVQKDILARVDDMPREWDGIELREYIADQFAQEVTLSQWLKGFYLDPAGKRYARKRLRAYRSEVATRNL